MSKKLTLEICKERLSVINKNLEILSKEYINSKEKLQIKCLKCENIFYNDWNHLGQKVGCPVCNGGVRYDINKIKDSIKHKDFILLSNEYINSGTKLKFKCKIDGHEWEAVYENIQAGCGCPMCAGKVICDKNRLSTNRPDLIKYFIDISVVDEYTLSSNKKVKLKCPDCGEEKMMTVAKLTDRGFSCPKCGDGFSVPEKFVYNILSQLNADFEIHQKFKWSDNKEYDFYIKSLNMIIEVHGRQHYEESTRGKSLKEEQENDLLKYNLAIRNGIDSNEYIVIDARNTTIEWLKSKCIESLSHNFDLSNIDYEDVYLNTNKSFMSKCWDLYKDGKNTTEIMSILKLSRTTVTRYLNVGTDIGLINYVRRNPSEWQNKRVEQYNMNGQYIRTFNSIKEANASVGVKTVYQALVGLQNQAGGFKWKYANSN